MIGNYLESAVQKAVGDNFCDSAMRQYISEWNDWYCGKDDDFHTVEVNNGVAVVKRPMYKLKMAKKVAEDWADLLFNEKTFITVNDTVATEFLYGSDGHGGVFGRNNFHAETNRLIEKAFALGTGAITVNIENAELDNFGRLKKSPQSLISLEYIGAENIFPISHRNGKVIDVAFAGTMTVTGEELIYVQIHTLESDGYVIRSKMYKGSEEMPLPENIAPVVRTGGSKPWFVLIKPNTVNCAEQNSPLGMSIFATATDILKGIDLCYDSLNMEFYLGKKMVFLRKDMLEQDSKGNFFAPQDCNRQLFMYVGDKNIDGDMLPQEFNPELRVSAHTEALKDQLRYLASKCGLGERSYSFEKGNIVTATQVISENSAMFRALKKHELLLESTIITLIRTLLYIGREIIGLDIPEKTEISMVFDDSIIEDKPSRQKTDLELVKEGIMMPYEFRMKHFGEDEETARSKTERTKANGKHE
ncbi:MAG: phage portal protein [Clostridia bacterium]|nr:phage portal protein [Clostridia bacterium]